MKKTLILAFILGLSSLVAAAQELTLQYREQEGKESLSLPAGSAGLLYKPSSDPSYYLFTDAGIIRIDFGASGQNEKKKVEILEGGEDRGIWHRQPDSTETKYPGQTFKRYSEEGFFIFRKADRKREIVKDQISIGGAKCFIWNPVVAAPSLSATVDGKTYTAGDTIRITPGKGVRDIKIQVSAEKKNSTGTVLQNILVGGDTCCAAKDEITSLNCFLSGTDTIVVSKQGGSFDIVLNYQRLDEKFATVSDKKTIRVEVEKQGGMPAGLWIPLVSGGGVLLVLCIVFLVIKVHKRKKSRGGSEEQGTDAPAVVEQAGPSEPEQSVPAVQEPANATAQQGTDTSAATEASTTPVSQEPSTPVAMEPAGSDEALTKKLEALQNDLLLTKNELQKAQNEFQTAKNDLESKLHEKDVTIDAQTFTIKRLEDAKKALDDRMKETEEVLMGERKAHAETKERMADESAKAEAAFAEAARQHKQAMEDKESECVARIAEVKKECDARTENWKADKDSFLAKICLPVERLYGISDDICRNIESQEKSYSESFEYIVSSISDFHDKVKAAAAEDGVWRKVTNAEAEKAIVASLTEQIRNNAGWINSIARLYCYSRLDEIGATFESNGVRVQDIDSAYRDMVSLLGIYGINVIVPRILVDYYDDISKKYFDYNNEDIIITKFVGRDILLHNKADRKIYDMGKIGYCLDGKVTKGEIVYF